MDFMGIGFGELIVIMAIALLILGPQRLARTARSAGKMARQVRQMGGEFTSALMEEAEDGSTAGPVGKVVREVRQVGGELTRALLDEAKDDSRSDKPKG